MVLAHNIASISRTEDVKNTQNIFFERMLLSEKTLEGLKLAGFVKPSPIQLHGIPLGKCGFDLLLEAKSGTGKTAVFCVIALEKLVLNNGLQVIILTPTREIAAQICDVIKEIGSQYEGLVVEVVMGGLPFEQDVAKFNKRKVHMVVSSPGRLHHLIKGNHIDTSSVRLIVFDEADKLLVDKCFAPDIKYILSKLPEHKQIIMSSATYPESSKHIIDKYMKNSQHVCPETSSVLIGVDQRVTFVKSHCNIVNQTRIKYAELLSILTTRQFKQCIIFCNYQARVTEIHKWLIKDNWPAEHLHGAQEQGHRLDSIKTLKEFKCRILISTDLAARGIDASNVDLVISLEAPREWTTYLHRIGRAGRYGSYGTAVTILSIDTEVTKFQNILNSIVVESGSLIIKDFWNDKVWNFAGDNVNDFINLKTINKEQSNLEQYKTTKDLNNILSMKIESKIEINNFDSLLSSFENETCVQSFDNLLNSFENDFNECGSEENVLFSTIKLENVNVDGILGKLNCNNSTFEDGDVNTHFMEEIKPSNPNKLSISSNNEENEMVALGLPTSFGTKGKNKNKIRNNSYKSKQNHPFKVDEQTVKRPETFEENYNYNTHVKNYFINDHKNTENESDSSSSSTSTDNYKEQHRHKQHRYHLKNQNRTQSKKANWDESYFQWYNQLKHNMRLLEQMVYIHEMSK